MSTQLYPQNLRRRGTTLCWYATETENCLGRSALLGSTAPLQVATNPPKSVIFTRPDSAAAFSVHDGTEFLARPAGSPLSTTSAKVPVIARPPGPFHNATRSLWYGPGVPPSSNLPDFATPRLLPEEHSQRASYAPPGWPKAGQARVVLRSQWMSFPKLSKIFVPGFRSILAHATGEYVSARRISASYAASKGLPFEDQHKNSPLLGGRGAADRKGTTYARRDESILVGGSAALNK
jgi:hypothetical protein